MVKLHSWHQVGLCLVASMLCALQPSTASAQSLFGSSGAASQTSGSTGSSTSNFSSNLGGGGGGAGGAGGGFGATNAATGGTSLEGPQFNLGDGSLGAELGQGFVGAGDGSTFIGNRLAGQGQAGNFASQFGALGQGGGRPTGGQVNGNLGREPTRAMAVQTRLSFDFPQPAVTEVQRSLTKTLASIPEIARVSEKVKITVNEGGEVVLSGVLPDLDEGRLLEAMIRLEPGVRSVRNELTAASQP